MSTLDDINLDLKVIAELLGPEDLDPPQRQATQNHEDDITPTIKASEDIHTQNALNQAITTPTSPKIMEQEEEAADSVMPGLKHGDLLASGVSTLGKPALPAQVGNSTTVLTPIDIVATSSSGEIGEIDLNTTLAKHDLQMITSESSDEEGKEDTSDEDEGSTSDDGSDSSDASDDSSSDSDGTSSSGVSKGVPIGHDEEDPSIGTYPLKAQHRTDRTKLDKMVEDDTGSEDGLDVRSGALPVAMFATAHEVIAPQVTMPSITEIPEDEPIEMIGEVMSIVDSVVVVKSLENGMQRVLDTDSMLVLEDRKVLGLVFETFGPLTAPLYSIRFPSAAHFPPAVLACAGSSNKPLKVYYCTSRSTFAYTSQLLLNRGNDASNFYDEEVAEDEREFSDDEEEREWKRRNGKVGAAKRKRRDGSNAASTYAQSPQLGERSELPYDDGYQEVMSTDGDAILSYVDPYDDEPASPVHALPSTSNGQSITSHGIPSLEPPSRLPQRPDNNRGSNHRPRARGRGQGNFSGVRGRGRGQGQEPRDRGRQLFRGQFLTTNIQRPSMAGYHNPAEYNPAFAGNYPPNLGQPPQFQPIETDTAMHHHRGAFPGAPSMGGMGFQPPFTGMQSPQPYGMHNGPINGMYGAGSPMYATGGGPGIFPAVGGPAPGAYVNPRFAMMQSPPPQRGSGTQHHQHGGGTRDSRQNPSE